MTAAEMETAALEYVLGLDGLGLGRKSADVLARCMARDVRPVLLKQRKELAAALVTGADPAAALAALDVELAAAWGRVLEALKVLWLTEGPREEGVSP